MRKVLSLVLHSFETDSRVLRACHSLVAAGYSVKVVALHEGALPVRQQIGAIEIERVQLWTRNWPKWRPVQIFKYLEWCIRVGWKFRAFRILHCNDLSALPAGVLLKMLSFGRARVIYDAHEFESNHKAGQSDLSIRALQLVEGFLIRFSDRVVTVSNGIAEEYARVYSIPRPTVVMNCPMLKTASDRNLFRTRFGIRENQVIFLTQGWLRPNRGIEFLLEAFSSMRDDSKVLIVMGRGPLEKLINEYASSSANIFHQPVVPPDQVIAHTACADFGIALIEDTSFSKRYCLPNKLFEYFMAGLPVIVSDLPEMRHVVEEFDVGIVCERFAVEEFIKACERLLRRDRGELVRNVAKASRHFNWDVQQQVWLDVVRRVAE